MLATGMWTHVLISFDENVENNLICSPRDQSKKSHDLAGDQVATEPLHCALCTALSSPGFVTFLILTPTGHYEHLCQFLWMKMRKSLNFSPEDQSRKSLDLLIKSMLQLSVSQRWGRFSDLFPASSLFFFLQKSKSTKRYRRPRLNE